MAAPTIDRMNPSLSFTVAFAIALLAHLLLKLWLHARQVRSVALQRHAVPAAHAQTLSLQAHQKAADYTLAKMRTAQVEMAVDALAVLAWTLLGGLAALQQWVNSWAVPAMVSQVLLVVVFAGVGALLSAPVSLWRTFGVEQRFGFNKTTPVLWLSDALKSGLLGLALGVPLLAWVLWLMAEGGAVWWLWAWAGWMLWQLLVMAIAPSLILPLFNRFTPLQAPGLQAQVQALLARAGFRAQGLFVVDGSKRSAHANAYLMGWGARKRVVFFDTLLAQLSEAEMLAVLAHELGHHTHRHIAKNLLAQGAIGLLSLALLGGLAQQVWFYTGLGVLPSLTGDNSAVALVLFMLVVPVVGFFVQPLLSWRSRVCEFEADAYAVQQTQAADLSSALAKLYQNNASTLTPDPWYVWFYASHPPASARLARIHAMPGGAL